MQDDQDNGESPALDTLEIWNGSSTAESATDEPLATRSAAYDFSGDDPADSGAYQSPLDDDARDWRTTVSRCLRFLPRPSALLAVRGPSMPILRRRERVTIDSRCVISRFGVARPSSSCCWCASSSSASMRFLLAR